MKILMLSLLILSACSDNNAEGWSFTEPTSNMVDATVEDMAERAPDIGPDVVPNPSEQAFVGFWRVDQPNHAGYEATIYDFAEDGVLSEIESQGFGSGQIPTGRVARCDGFRTREGYTNCETWGPECVFSNEWTATDAQTLLITSICDDGEDRKVSIHFASDFDTPQSPKVSVSGDENWLHNDFDWAWTLCPSVEECRWGT
jgi:hypothetical protein